MPRKSFLKNHRKPSSTNPNPSTSPVDKTTPLKGDLDGDGDVDWVDKIIAAVKG